MVLYKSVKQLNDAGFNPTPGALQITNALFSPELAHELAMNTSNFVADKNGNLMVTIIVVVADEYTSKSGNTYIKGTTWVVPQK